MRTLYKYFVFSDVHGEYNALIRSLEEAGYERNNPTHKLVSLGDEFDRGPDSRKIYNFLTQNHAICVKGNHDVMFQEYLEKGMDGEYVLFNILHNGLGETIKSFSGLQDNQFSINVLDEISKKIQRGADILQWLQQLPLYYETDSFIFVHAGINPNLIDWHKTTEHYALWDIEDSHKPCPNTNKVIIFGHHHAFRVRAAGEKEGHQEIDMSKVKIQGKGKTCAPDGRMRYCTPVSYGNKDEHRPYIIGNKIAIDGCTNLTKKVNVLVIEDYEKDEPINQKEQEPIIQSVIQDNNTTVNYSNYTVGEPQWTTYNNINITADPNTFTFTIGR